MKLIVNGNELETSARTLSELFAGLGYEGDWYATAVNGEFVPGTEREATALSDGDRVEILTPRQGG